MNKFAHLCFACGEKGKLRFGSDGVWCKSCRKLESWDNYHRRIKEMKYDWNNTVVFLQEIGKGQGF